MADVSNLFGRANPSPERVGVSRFAPAFLCRMALFGFLSAGQWNVALKVHSVVEHAYDFDRAVWCYSVDQEVASTTTLPRYVARPKTRYDLVSGLGARDIGTVGTFAEGNLPLQIECGHPVMVASGDFEPNTTLAF